jgi:hypothetical protein
MVMSKMQYWRLIDKFCEELGIEDVQPVHEKGHLTLMIDDFLVALHYGNSQDESGLYTVVECGEPPSEIKEQVLRRLLEKNFFLFGDNQPNFSLCPVTGGVLLMRRSALLSATVESTLDTMSNLLQFAKVWRANQFLDFPKLHLVA